MHLPLSMLFFNDSNSTLSTSNLQYIFHVQFSNFFSVESGEWEWDMDEIRDIHKNHDHGIESDRRHHEELTRERFENGLRKIYFNYLTKNNQLLRNNTIV